MALGLTFSAGNRVYAADLQAIADQVDVLTLGVPDMAIATRAAAQSYTSAEQATLSLDTEVIDTASMFAATDSKIYAATTGVHQATGYVDIASPGSSGMFIAEIRLSGTSIANIDVPLNNNGTARATVTIDRYMTAGQYMELWVYNGTGATRNVTGQLSLIRMGSTP
jgi:hypothetical protein